MGADGKEACSLFQDLELFPECGVGWGAMACKVLEQEGELCRQEGMLYRWQCGSLIRTDLKS